MGYAQQAGSKWLNICSFGLYLKQLDVRICQMCKKVLKFMCIFRLNINSLCLCYYTMLGTSHDPGLGIMEFAQPLHIGVCTVSPCRSLHSLFYHNFPRTWCFEFCSHISLKDTTCCVCIPAP
jgi:hypothetical protein